MRNTRSLLLAPPTFWFRWHSCDNEWAIRGTLCQHRLGSSQCSVLIKQSDSPCRKSDFPFPIFMVVSQFHEPNTSESWGNNQNVKTGCKKLVSHSTLYESSISFYFELHFRALWLNMKAPSYLCIAKSYCWNAAFRDAAYRVSELRICTRTVCRPRTRHESCESLLAYKVPNPARRSIKFGHSHQICVVIKVGPGQTCNTIEPVCFNIWNTNKKSKFCF